jgi:hypothetical protein
MSDNATSMPERRSCAEHKVRDELEKLSPRRWIYRNLTPWRIHACFAPDGKLLTARGPAVVELPCDKCVGQVLSIPALGEVLVPAEDARRLNTLNMRRLGQIELRPAPSEFLSNLPRAVMILGWLVVGLIFGGGHCSSWRQRAPVGVARGGCGRRPFGRPDHRHGP